MRKIMIFFILFILIYKLIADSLLWDFLPFLDGKIFSFFCFIILFFVYYMKDGQIHLKKSYINIEVTIFLSVLAIAILFRQDSFWITDLCMLVALIIIFESDFNVFELFACASSLAICPFFLRWLLAVFRVGEYMGNRGPIHFTTIALLLVAIMFIKNFHWKWQFIVLSLAILIDFVGQSRTYMVVCVLALFLLTYFNFKGKLTTKKIALLFIIILFIAIFMIKFQNQIVELFTNKWTGQTTIFTGRSMMWIDVLSEFHFWGYEEGYIQNKYMLGNVHNAFIQSYVSYGLVVGILYILLIIELLIKCIKMRKNKTIQGLIIAFVPITIAAFFESNFILEQEYVYLGICNAFLINLILKASNDSMRI